MKKVSDILRDYQLKTNLNQHEMALLLGISQSTYNNWVNEQVAINPLKHYKKIASLCEIDIDLILPKSTKWELYKSQDIEVLNNKLENCNKYSKSLEELNVFLKKENERLLEKLKGKEMILEK